MVTKNALVTAHCSATVLSLLARAGKRLRRHITGTADVLVSPTELKEEISQSDAAWIFPGAPFAFAGSLLSRTELIYESEHSFAMLCRHPVLPGHAIVAPKKPVNALFDLSEEEAEDLFLCTQAVSWLLSCFTEGQGSTIRLQQGEAAGQTLDTLYIHVLPRKIKDLPNNDLIYDLLDACIPVISSSASERAYHGTPNSEAMREEELPEKDHAERYCVPAESKQLSEKELEFQCASIRALLQQFAAE